MELSSVASTFALYRFGLSALLAVGGIACIWFGYKLFMNGAGLAKAIDKIDLKRGKDSLAAAGLSVGAVLVLTSGFWGYFSYSSFPKLEVAGDFIKITGVPIEKAIGAQVVSENNENVGTIMDILINSKAQATGIVISIDKLPNGKKVVVNPKDFHFALDKNNATVRMRAEAVRNLPSFDWKSNLTKQAPQGPNS